MIADLDQNLDQQVTLVGTAMDAHAGAVVVLPGDRVVYIDGLDYWDTRLAGRTIQVTGVLRKKKLGPDPQVDAQGAVSHGIEGQQYVLDGAQWSPS